MGVGFESHWFYTFYCCDSRDTSLWRRGRDSFSPVVPLLLRSRPPSLPFAMLTFPSLKALDSASNPFILSFPLTPSLSPQGRGYEQLATSDEQRIHGGEGGIRTLGKALDPPHDFQSCTFDRSVTSPIFPSSLSFRPLTISPPLLPYAPLPCTAAIYRMCSTSNLNEYQILVKAVITNSNRC